MGAILSSTRGYNRTLAKQPRKSIGLTKFQVPNIQQQPLIGTLSIPFPVRNSQLNDRSSNNINELSQIELTSIPNEPVQSPESTPIIQQREPSIVQSPSYSSQPSFPTYHPNMNSKPMILRRSIINLNKHRRLNDHQLASYAPNRSIVERNGKQYLTELGERMERRYVQIFDETTGQMRLFEVTDYIPTRTVRPVRNNPPMTHPNNTRRNSFSTRPPFNQRPPSRHTPNGRNELTTPSNFRDFKDLKDRDTVAREFNLYHSGAGLPFNSNNNASPTLPYQPQLAAPDSISAYSHFQPSQPKAYNSSTIASQYAPNEYSHGSYQSQARSFRQHSPTGSDYSRGSSTLRSISENSDVASVNRALTPTHERNRSFKNNSGVSYGTIGGQNSPTQPDPFAKTVHPGDHTYTKRPGFNNYSEPITNNRGFTGTGVSDYAPLPMSHNQSNRNQRKESNAYDG